MPQFVWIGNSGCLLPLLIVFNLLFGKLIFNSTRLWLSVEAVLILIFIIKVNIIVRKISRKFSRQGHGGEVVDIQGDVVEEEKKLK